MTNDEFRKLPLLVRPATAAELLGTTVQKLHTTYELETVLTKKGHRRYRKQQLARLVGLEAAL